MRRGCKSAEMSRVRFLLLFTALLICGSDHANARIGETTLQFIARYGAPKDTPASKIMDKGSPLVEGAIHHRYEYQGWKIRAAFLQLDGPAVRMEYSKIGPAVQIKDYELEAIMTANTPPGTTWKQIAYNNPDLPSTGLNKFSQALAGSMMGEKMWQRTDGAILWLRSSITVRLELPVAREYEAQLKAEKEQKARASVPQF
jgi:hypothetical protein